jgi:hypothetical protein
MYKDHLVGKRVKYMASVMYNTQFKKPHAGDELIIKSVDIQKKMLILTSPTGEIWTLFPHDVRYLNNMKIKL